jgi:aromatic ring-opening dioxygenase LigB subunit
MGGIVFAAIAPHGTLAIEDALPAEESATARATQQAMADLERRFTAAAPDSVVVFTPHNVHVEGAMAVVEAGRLAGDLAMWGAPGLSMEAPVDRELAAGVKAAVREAGIPVVGISFGGNDAASAVHPMDWAVMIPLWFMGGRAEPQVPAVVVSPARDLSPESHVRAGRAIAEAAERSGRRVAFVASCDHGHGHDPAGPYGFRPESAAFDDRVVELVKAGELGRLLEFEQPFVHAAAADSWWQMLMLHGALGDRWRPEFLAYEHPSYFGMLCSAFTPANA